MTVRFERVKNWWLLALVAGVAVAVAITIGAMMVRHGAAAGPEAALSYQDAAATAAAKAVHGTAASSPTARQVIEHGTVNLAVAHLQYAVGRVDSEVAAVGGYVASSSVSGQGSNQVGTLTLRVPEQDFAQVMGAVERMGRVTGQSQSGVDVTGEVNNVNVQLTALRSEISAYEALFQKAASMSAMLQIQQALSQAEANLLSVKQQAQNLHQAVAMATISVRVTALAVVGGKGVRVGAVFRGSLASMLAVGRTLLAGVVWIMPWAALAGGVSAMVLWWRRRRPGRLAP